eukprot:1141918-Pelagomonas_calceolata.AAC.3
MCRHHQAKTGGLVNPTHELPVYTLGLSYTFSLKKWLRAQICKYASYNSRCTSLNFEQHYSLSANMHPPPSAALRLPLSAEPPSLCSAEPPSLCSAAPPTHAG